MFARLNARLAQRAQRSLLAVGIVAGASVYCCAHAASAAAAPAPEGRSPPRAPALGAPSERVFSLPEIRTMAEAGRLVVTLQGVVYDVTDFTGHPGGVGRLQMVAGQDLAPYWSVYTQHNRGHVLDFLQRYRIGVVSAADAEAQRASSHYDNPYVHDPPPYPELLTNTRYPYNAEARLRDLGESWITPIGRHFVRNHGTVPDIDAAEYVLTVQGAGLRKTEFSLAELKDKFPRVEITNVIQCNGNRREDFHFLREGEPAFGPPHWVAGAIGNARWAGARMRDVLRAAGMDVDAISLRTAPAPPGAENVSLLGMDHDEVGNQYCCSFPFEKAVDPFGDVLIAYEMNGQPIPRAHGFPVRAIVPGHAGARNCKYLERVTVTPAPCLGNGNWKQYAVHAPDVPVTKIAEFDLHKEELRRDPAVQEMPVQSLISQPSAGDTLSLRAALSGSGVEPTVRVKGFAWGGGGDGINRVDVSIDGGTTFTRADLLPSPGPPQRRGGVWSWVFFEKEVPLPPAWRERLARGEAVQAELVSKALNTAWNVQPEFPHANINPHGCCVNHYYRVPVTLDPKAPADVPGPMGDFPNKPSGGAFRRPFRNMDPPAQGAPPPPTQRAPKQ